MLKILIFGGTGEARDLANRLVFLGHEVTTSLAGRTLEPLLPQGELRVGGFGGVDALKGFFAANGVDWVVDATHPFAENMSAQLVAAAELAGVPLLRLLRPAWEKPSGAEWIDVPDIGSAFALIPEGAGVLITSGHDGLDHCAAQKTSRFVVRLIETPMAPLPGNCTLLIARPPYTFDGEMALMRAQGITHMIAKNAGGMQTRAKIDAAAALDVVTLMIGRQPLPAAREVSSVDQALAVLQEARS